jgi:hypothetical protein
LDVAWRTLPVKGRGPQWRRCAPARNAAALPRCPQKAVFDPSSNCSRKSFWRLAMENDTAELDAQQAAYKAAVEEWIVAIRREETLASVNHTVAQLDQWEQAHFDEDEARNKVLSAKAEYEDALRRKFFDF